MIKQISILLLLFLHVTVSNASMVEKQKYRVVKTYDGFEIRYYPPATLATVYTSANSYREIATPGFRTLAGYIFGGNASETKISMTSPVHMDINDSLSAMSFVMPSKYEMKDLPAPDNSRVVLEESKPEYVAALRFGGYASDRAIQRQSEKLAARLDEAGISYYGNFRYLGYNPPYQFIGRRNEIIVSVRWSEDK
ncbi:MAG: SOUL family heme-binding protein [Bacteroidales bacterium]